MLWDEIEDSIGSEAVSSVSDQRVFTCPVLVSEAADDAQLRPQSPLHTGILSMEQYVDRIVSETQAGSSSQ